jgi:hypothetical protein
MGECGGTAAYSLSVDNVTGSFTGVFNFNAYCYNGTVISGGANCSGIYNISESRFTTLTVHISSLTAQDSIGIYSVSGIMAADFPSSISYNCTMTLYLSRNGKVYWMENYSLGAIQFTDYMQMTFMGKYYHPDYGYVTVTTPTPFQAPTGALYPSQGVLIGTGANSSAARLTILSNTTYMVECDADGDGTYEWSSGTKTWP